MQLYPLLLNIISGCWLVFVATWVIGALSTKRTVYRETHAQRLRYWVWLMIACFLLLYGRRLPYPLNLRIVPAMAPSTCAGCSLVHHRSRLRILGQNYSRAQLERCRDTERRTRTGGARAVPICAASHLHGHSYHVLCHCAGARGM
jgi:hypothetical protein